MTRRHSSNSSNNTTMEAGPGVAGTTTGAEVVEGTGVMATSISSSPEATGSTSYRFTLSASQCGESLGPWVLVLYTIRLFPAGVLSSDVAKRCFCNELFHWFKRHCRPEWQLRMYKTARVSLTKLRQGSVRHICTAVLESLWGCLVSIALSVRPLSVVGTF